MSAIRLSWSRLIAVFRKQHLDEDFNEEALSHIALAAEDYQRHGMPLADAQRLARIRFGSLEAEKEGHRDSRGLPWLESLFYDLRFALRSLRRDRAFALTAVGMLALTIGLNVTVFVVVNAMLFRGFPLVKGNDRLLYMQEQYPAQRCCLTYLDFEDWRAQAHSFEGMAFVGEKNISLGYGEGHSLDENAFTVSTNAFGLLGVRPLLGRDFVPADGAAGAAPVVILNYRFWGSQFGRRRDVVGTSVRINKAPATIIGVMPESFDFPAQFDVWMPFVRGSEVDQRAPQAFLAFGRLQNGAKVQTARAELATINHRLEVAWPKTNRGVVPRVDTYSQFFIGPDAPIIYGSLWVAAWFVLLIACANLASLTLARTIGRWHEFSTRLALGAGIWRMICQVFIESLLLVAMAGILAWWIAKWSVGTWAVATASRHQIVDYSLDSGTIAYLIAISLGAAILFSLAPIAKLVELGTTGILHNDARGVTQSRGGKRLGKILVAAQVALAMVLLSGAGVLVKSLLNVVHARTGVLDPENILVGFLRPPSGKYPDPAMRAAYFDRLEAELRAVPGIRAASLANNVPTRGGALREFDIEGRPNTRDSEQSAGFLNVGPDYFRVLGLSASSGAEFSDRDRTAPVALVNQSFAARFLPREQPLGKRLRMNDRVGAPGEWLTVVGVVPNIMQNDPTRRQFKPLVYLPFQPKATNAPFFCWFSLLTAVPPQQVAQVVRARIQRLDPDAVLDSFGTLKAIFAFNGDYMDREHSEMQKHATVAPLFAVLAMLLAAIGLYAVFAHSVGQRTKEIGIRMAIGARAAEIRGMILRDGMWPVLTGIVFGMAASFGANRVLQSQLVGVSPYDIATTTGAPVVLIIVALVACRIPARRAMRTDPTIALRYE